MILIFDRYKPNISILIIIKYIVCLLSLAACIEASAKDCRFVAPVGWDQASVRWDGDCQEGRANGLGVLKEYTGRKVVRLFFGRVKNGQLEHGVIDQSDGYIAGQFSNGILIPSESRQVTVAAFHEATKAAQQTADNYLKSKNHPSARFYSLKAKQLREQMD